MLRQAGGEGCVTQDQAPSIVFVVNRALGTRPLQVTSQSEATPSAYVNIVTRQTWQV